MAFSASKYLADARLNLIKGTTFPAAPANLYLAAYTTQPADDGTGGVEVSGGSYARVAIASTGWSAITDGSGAGASSFITNAALAAFPQATANWGTVVAVGLLDAASAGNLWYCDVVTVNETVNNNDTLEFTAGNLKITEG